MARLVRDHVAHPPVARRIVITSWRPDHIGMQRTQILTKAAISPLNQP